MLETAQPMSPTQTLAGEYNPALEEVMKKVRLYCLQQRVRIDLYLHDFDKTRSGVVTRAQFQRALHMSGLTNVISEREYDVLFSNFLSNRDVTCVNYAAFVEAVDEVFTKKRLEKQPGAVATAHIASHVLHQPTTLLSPEEENVLGRLQTRFVAETRALGIVLKTCFVDFDKHRSGKIPPTQFERAMPFKMDPSELRLIIRKYTAPNKHVDYQKWINDINMASEGPAPVAGPIAVPEPPRQAQFTADSLIAEIRKQIKQSRIRISESMTDYDKLRSGMITPHQFKASLGRFKLQRLPLTDAALDLLCEKYMVTDHQGYPKICYQQFVNEMDEVFSTKGMEKDPSKTLTYKASDFKNNPRTKDLSSEQEERVQNIMNRIKNIVRSRRMLLKPAFQDFDRATKGLYQTRSTSKRRFERVLALNNINLTEEEYALLEEKYEVPGDSDNVNYVLFCQHLEEEDSQEGPANFTAIALPQKKYLRTGKTGVESLEEVMSDIRAQVLTQRIRIKEFLRDYDKLKSGLILKEQFAAGLNMAKIELDEKELQCLVGAYGSEKRKGAVRWTAFCDDVDEVHTTKNLECSPSKVNHTQHLVTSKMFGERAPRVDGPVMKILEKLREAVRTRGILLPPFFKDFDVRNTGQITANRLGQALTRHGFGLSPQEVETIVQAYADPRTRDVCYRKLINDIDETEKMPVLASTMSDAPTQGLPIGYGFTHPQPLCDIEELLEEIRSKVAKGSIRIKDFFVDADKLRKGSVPKSKFRTGLDVGGIRLDERKLCMLEERFVSASGEGVDYVAFSAEVSPDTQDRDLEKNPNKSRTMYKPSSSHPLKSMLRRSADPSNEALVEAILHKLRTLTTTRRILLKPVFLDFDKIRKGHVSPYQFAAALDRLQLKLLPEECQKIIENYETVNGDVNYTEFCAAIDPQ
eukprot:TRINITY_DN3996_c0_g1_i1.p1 TRINITY_DN3996_c0_g1~~TRINITY_DN3996_c0_g1_i1.p1  ORF type:complete len:922 (+),score=250.59 TRINITY_DN3996_c0_g1_i1:75-2840(+)